MIIVMQPDAGEAEIAAVEARSAAHGLDVHVSRGTERTLIGAIGDERKLDPEMFDPLPGVERSMHILKPYKLVAREWHKASTTIDVGGTPHRRQRRAGDRGPVLGGDSAADGSGRCGRRGRRRAADARRRVQAAHEPVRVPGQGHRGPDDAEATRRRATGLPIVTELMDVRHARHVPRARRRRHPDRHAQHAELRPAEGGRARSTCRCILKRGMSATISEWLMAAEYIAAGGNHRIMLCERGIRTFETAYRNVLDVTAVAVLKKETHLPVIVDPSHAGGKAWMVPALSCAAVAAGADGLLIEVHPCPAEAWCDADQALSIPEFAQLMQRIGALARCDGHARLAPPLAGATR